MIYDEIRTMVQWPHTQSNLCLTMIRRLYCCFLLLRSVYSLHGELDQYPLAEETRNVTERWDYVVEGDIETDEIARDIFVENGTGVDLVPSLYQNEENRTFLDIEEVEILR